ncbi:MAG: aspartate kinase, partial [Spirochaetota bacterium]
KFGGASVCDAASVRNVGEIIRRFGGPLFIVISAMGKTTNAFERLLASYLNDTGDTAKHRDAICTYHRTIVKELFPDTAHPVHTEIESVFNDIQRILQSAPSSHAEYEYDRLVSYGEILSSLIVSASLNDTGIENVWLDARTIIKTDNTFTDAAVLWEETKTILKERVHASATGYCVMQGFIGGTIENLSTTLGREGSDYTAAIVAHCLDAESVAIWKNVPGILHADPAYFQDTQKIDTLSYHDAIELAYYGAKVIHPKTIKPLQNKAIPLYVKSFVDPDSSGTRITEEESIIPCPVYIVKRNQVVLTISPYDFSFIAERNLSEIFSHLDSLRIRLNVMQNSAISFSMAADYVPKRIDTFINRLRGSYRIRYNAPVELLTIWHYDDDTILELTQNKEILLEEKSRYTAQYVTRNA